MCQAYSIYIVIADVPGGRIHWVEGIRSVHLVANYPTTDSTVHKVFRSFDEQPGPLFELSGRPHDLTDTDPLSGYSLQLEGHWWGGGGLDINIQIGNYLPKPTSTGMAWVKKHCSWDNVLYTGLVKRGHPRIHRTIIQYIFGHGQVKKKHQLLLQHSALL
jgi:hypothetical protein